MILQSTLSPSTPHSLSSNFSSISLSFPSGSYSFISFPTAKPLNKFSVKCSVPQVYSHGTLDYEKRPMPKWNNIYRKIALMDNPEFGVASVLNQFENEGKRLTKWELCRIVRELRKFKRFQLALEVYEWMSNRIERYKITSSDTAIQLDLIAKVRGVASAEEYFVRVPDTLKDNRIFGALLNAYAGAKVRNKAESLMGRMRDKGYLNHPLPFNVMMTFYMKINEYDQVEKLVSEMKQRSIPLDLYSYNIWLSARGSYGSAEGMEQVFEEMKLEPTIVPNWTTYSTVAAVYIKLEMLEKAGQCLKDLETRITGRDRMPYHYLISLYGSLGNNEEVYRVWNTYKSTFANVPNWGYHSVISSLARLADIEGAEKIYEEWLSVKASYDPKVANLLMGWYVREEPFEKVKSFFDHMVEDGGKPNSGSWEILGEGHIKEGRISEALSCFREAVLVDSPSNWRPKPPNVSAFIELCEQEADHTSKEDFIVLLKQLGCLQDESYRSLLVGLSDIDIGMDEGQFVFNKEAEEMESEEPEMLFSVAE
ncbi:pentatricopeptide repeat-containing protein At1g02150-like [Chenopodium quinoa]|uniref:pentatricopeptide repeat-containing protein At1g02150-like n=1 Tax=Chenopodium quinoa TaxID=63459 RepID=UPI000B78894E|nr:pentatricopeptide repeat-containing protein At1g02150-like [Chenopodium quinoa]